jgi:hypothetical protein
VLDRLTALKKLRRCRDSSSRKPDPYAWIVRPAAAGMAGSDLKVVACHLCFGAKRDGFRVSDLSASPRAT